MSDLLRGAALTRQVERGAKPWVYAWCKEEYRRSPNAAASSPEGPIVFSREGVDALEAAVKALLADRRVHNAWADDDLWQLVVSAVSTLPLSLDDVAMRSIITNRVTRLVLPGITVVAFAIANATWRGDPLRIGEAVLGTVGQEWLALVKDLVPSGETFLDHEELDRWLADIEKSACETGAQEEHHLHAEDEDGDQGFRQCGNHFPMDVSIPKPVVFATKSRFQQGRSVSHANERFNEIVNLALLLHSDDTGTIRTSRPAFDRPARRGVMLDRTAIEHAIARTNHVGELASNTLICSAINLHASHSWHQAQPLNLAEVLASTEARKQIEDILSQNAPLSRRLRIAARWYSQAHWSEQDIDAVLSLGIALDALVGDKSGLPTSALAERYGLLEPKPNNRAMRSSEFREMYQVRSAVAHGSLTPTKVDFRFREKMVAAVRWATQRIIAFDAQFAPAADSDVRTAFENLRWGTATWY